MAAAFGRLCVETIVNTMRIAFLPQQPPSGGCVLKHFLALTNSKHPKRSRLRAAVC